MVCDSEDLAAQQQWLPKKCERVYWKSNWEEKGMLYQRNMLLGLEMLY